MVFQWTVQLWNHLSETSFSEDECFLFLHMQKFMELKWPVRKGFKLEVIISHQMQWLKRSGGGGGQTVRHRYTWTPPPTHTHFQHLFQGHSNKTQEKAFLHLYLLLWPTLQFHIQTWKPWLRTRGQLLIYWLISSLASCHILKLTKMTVVYYILHKSQMSKTTVTLLTYATCTPTCMPQADLCNNGEVQYTCTQISAVLKYCRKYVYFIFIIIIYFLFKVHTHKIQNHTLNTKFVMLI